MKSCVCGYISDAHPFSSDYAIGHKLHHMARYPDAGLLTEQSLDTLIGLAKNRERRDEESRS